MTLVPPLDRMISSMGLLIDGVSLLSPLGLALIGVVWYSNESVAVQAFLVLIGLLLALIGLIKRGSISESYSEILILACGFIVFLAFYEFAASAMASTTFGDRCAEIGDPMSCSIMNNVKLLELLFWPAIMTPALTLTATILALRQFGRGTSAPSPTML